MGSGEGTWGLPASSWLVWVWVGGLEGPALVRVSAGRCSAHAAAASRLPWVGAGDTWLPSLGSARLPLDASGLCRAPAVRVGVSALRCPSRSLGLVIGMTGLLGPELTGHRGGPLMRSGSHEDSCRGSGWSRPEKLVWGLGTDLRATPNQAVSERRVVHNEPGPTRYAARQG